MLSSDKPTDPQDPSFLYTLEAEIGKGSFGKVYLGRNTVTKEKVAVKVIDFLSDNADDIQDIKQEVSILSELNSPYVTRYFGSYVKGNCLWIVMEYCSAGSGGDLLSAGLFDEMQVSILVRQLLKGLEYIHSLGKIHRDIKAANILCTDQGQVKLADFGVSAEITATITRKNTFVGTPYWMPPEIWSLGITCIELAKGVPPHSKIHPMRVLFLIPQQDPPRLGKGFSPEFNDFVSKCLVKRASQRLSASELLIHPFIQKYLDCPDSILANTVIARYKKHKKLRADDQNAVNVPKHAPVEDTDDALSFWDFGTDKKKTIGKQIAFADEFDERPYNVSPLHFELKVDVSQGKVIKRGNDLVEQITEKFSQLSRTDPRVAIELLDRLKKIPPKPIELPRNGLHAKLVKRWLNKIPV